MNIEAGKFYKSRNGKKYGPIEPRPFDNLYPWKGLREDGSLHTFSATGSSFIGRTDENDLVAPWREPTEDEKAFVALYDEIPLNFYQKAYKNFLKKQKPWSE